MSKKDIYYFSHDSNARRDPKIVALMKDYCSAGYGMYWILIEILREQESYKIDLTKGYIIESIASEMMCDKDTVTQFIKKCISFELIETDGINIWSNSLNSRMELFNEKRSRYSSMARKRWEEKKEIKKEENKDDVEKFDFKKSLISLGVSSEIASDWMKVRSKKKSANTKTAFNSIASEITKSGGSPSDCISLAVTKSWAGFKAEWFINENGGATKSRNEMVY